MDYFQNISRNSHFVTHFDPPPPKKKKVKKESILKVSKEQSLPTNDRQVTANKKQNIVIAGDSMLNNIEDQYNLNTKKANVSIKAFSWFNHLEF